MVLFEPSINFEVSLNALLESIGHPKLKQAGFADSLSGIQ